MIHCPLCSKIAVVRYHKHPSYIKGLYFEIINCDNCNTSFVNPLKIDSAIYEQIYNIPAEVEGYNRYARLGEQILKERKPLEFLIHQSLEYSFIINEIQKSYTKGDKILEVGCGIGYLTWALNISGFTTTGTDIADNVIENAILKYGNYFIKGGIESIQLQNTKFDNIILTEVIEHIPEPILFLEKIKSRLNKDGVILITTPNKSAFIQKALWVTDAPPIHLWWFSEKSFIFIARNLSLKYKIVRPRAVQKGAFHYLNKSDKIEYPIFIPDTGFEKNFKRIINDIDEKSGDKMVSYLFYIMRNIFSVIPFRKSLIKIRNVFMRNIKSRIPYTLCLKLYIK
jgi:2-polyprenyl-3-methyl-5-hydroxy-6-metoxy-1,4-benzoquinol methylase